MGRREKDADFDWFMRALGEFPWWAAVLLAGIVFVTFEYAVPWTMQRMVEHAATTQDSIPGRLWGPLSPYVARVGAGAILFLWVLAAGVRFVKSRRPPTPGPGERRR